MPGVRTGDCLQVKCFVEILEPDWSQGTELELVWSSGQCHPGGYVAVKDQWTCGGSLDTGEGCGVAGGQMDSYLGQGSKHQAVWVRTLHLSIFALLLMSTEIN